MKYQFGYLYLILSVLLTNCGSPSPVTGAAEPKEQVLGGAGGAETNVVDSVSGMEAGDIYYVTFDTNGSADIDFSGSGGGAQYMLIVQSTETSSSNVSITTADTNPPSPPSFETMLRQKEAEFANEEPASPALALNKALTKAVGDTSTFRVLSSITSTTAYETVTAVTKCIRDHIILYLDTSVPSSDLDDDDIDTLCTQFEHAVSAEEAVLGEYSDINGDGRIVILITPQVNRLGASGGGIITGFFYAADLYANTASNPTSNEMEIVYILTPDPDGEYGTEIPKDFAMSNLMPAVVPHEVQHAINYNQHVLINGGGTEENWLNEALSHFTEDLVGFGVENPSRVEVFLSAPESTSLAPSGSPDLSERGAEYLFIRYLYERAGDPDGFLAALENTTLTGEENVTAAFASADLNFDEWDEFMRRWAIAVALTNTGISNTAEYQFNSRTLNATTGNWEGACLICEAEDNRGTTLTGPYAPDISSGTLSFTLAGTATAFYAISSPPSAITLQGNASAGLQGVLIRTE